MENKVFQELKDKVCVITGGAGVIGSAVVRGLTSVGMKTVILDINGKLAAEVSGSIQAETGVEVLGLQADVLSRESLEKARDAIHKKLGRISYLINGAAWTGASIADDPRVASNVRGTVSFAQRSTPNTRSVQLFINLKNNVRLDSAIGYVAPTDKLAGRDRDILAVRDQRRSPVGIQG